MYIGLLVQLKLMKEINRSSRLLDTTTQLTPRPHFSSIVMYHCSSGSVIAPSLPLDFIIFSTHLH